MKRNVSVVRFKFCCNILIGGKIIKEMPGSVASGTPFICNIQFTQIRVYVTGKVNLCKPVRYDYEIHLEMPSFIFTVQ